MFIEVVQNVILAEVHGLGYAVVVQIKEVLLKEGEREHLLSVSEAARYLNVSRSSLYRHVKNKLIPCIRIDWRIRFRMGELQVWVNDHSIQEVMQ